MQNKIDANTPWEEMTPGGDIYEAGNAKEFKDVYKRQILTCFQPNVNAILEF